MEIRNIFLNLDEVAELLVTPSHENSVCDIGMYDPPHMHCDNWSR